MQKGRRKPIPKQAAAFVQFISDRTCCVCRQREKLYQIHHIDNNRNNNEEDNLAILCDDCHNLTQIQGGFYRKLSPALVRLYRDEWLRMVARSKQLYEDPGSLSSNNSWAIVENTSPHLSLSLIRLAPSSIFSIYDSVLDSNGNSINISMNSRTVENQIRRLYPPHWLTPLKRIISLITRLNKLIRSTKKILEMESKKSLARTYPHLKVRFCNNFKAGNAFIVDNVAELLYQKLDWKLRNSDEFTTPLRINKDGRYHTLLDARLFISSTMQGDMNKNKLLRLLTSLSTRKKLKNKIKSIDEIRSELAQSLRALNQGQ